MTRRRPPPVVAVAASPDECEAQFYEALQLGDLERLMALWLDDDAAVCVHPGGARLVGTAAIRAGFEAVFSHGGIPVQPEQVQRLTLPDAALHHLIESIQVPGEQGAQGAQRAWVVASNLYVRTALGWRIAAHHASPGTPQALSADAADLRDAGDGPTTLH